MGFWTPKTDFVLARAVTAADTPLMDGASASQEFLPATRLLYPERCVKIPERANSFEMCFSSGLSAAATVKLRMYSYGIGDYSPCIFWWSGILTVGSAVAPNTELYIDSASSVLDNHPLTVRMKNTAVATNGILTLYSDWLNCNLYTEVYDFSSTPTTFSIWVRNLEGK
jgi:hypothetical protein